MSRALIKPRIVFEDGKWYVKRRQRTTPQVWLDDAEKALRMKAIQWCSRENSYMDRRRSLELRRQRRHLNHGPWNGS